MKLDTLLSTTLVICALVTTGIVGYREFFASTAMPEQPIDRKAVFIENWKSQLGRGVQLGSSSAPVQLLEFADFECPFCATLHTRLNSLRQRHSTAIALSFVHYPLLNHRFALPAARAAECAGEQGRFEAMHDLLFDQQPAFGLKSWNEFAVEAGVSDPAAFDLCAKSNVSIPRIIDGRKFGEELGIRGTPTLVINGWMLAQPPSTDELERMVTAILAGRSPVDAAGEPTL